MPRRSKSTRVVSVETIRIRIKFWMQCISPRKCARSLGKAAHCCDSRKREREAGNGDSEIRSRRAGRKPIVSGSYRLGERDPRRTQQEKQFASPKQNIQQAPALQIAQVLRLQADVQCLSRAFLDEGSHGGQVDGFSAELAPPRVKAFQLFITAQQKMVQAESLAIQCCNRGAATRTHPAVSLPNHRIHPTQAH